MNESLQAGTTISHYRILSRLGAGGMGEVYLAEDTQLGRKIALKLLSADLVKHEERLRRFEQEARAASALNHPNILTIFEIGHAESTHFIANEYIEGETLRQHMARTRMTLREVLDVAVQVASALAAAHAAGIIHRDLKPGNIMVRPDGYVKVLDFGLAKLTQREALSTDSEAATIPQLDTEPGKVMGTANYMSPEQARGLEVDARTDIFSQGVVLYEMIAGRSAFEGETNIDVIASILKAEPPPLTRFATDAPGELQRIVSKALRKDKEERYQTNKDLLVDLRSLKQELELQAKGGLRFFAVEPESDSGMPEKTLPRSQHKAGRRSKAINSLAILPLVNSSADPNLDYLTDGVTESIINSLSQLPKLKVMARSMVFRYKSQDVDPQAVGRALNVRAVASGRVLQLGQSLVIGVELINVEDGTQLWGEQYRRTLSDIFTVQEEIAREISEKLRLRLTGKQKRQLTKRYTENAEAYQLYLKGRYHWNKRTPEGLQKGMEYFQQAVDKDPSYALAHAGLADGYGLLAYYGGVPPREVMPKAKAAALKALEIDEGLAEAHVSLGLVSLTYEWDWPAARTHFERALALNSSYPTAHHWYSHYLLALGRSEEALAEAKRALDLDPVSPVINFNLGGQFYGARQFDQAIEQSRKTEELDPSFPLTHWMLGASYAAKGMYREALAEHEKYCALSGSTPWSLAYLGHALARAGERNRALQLLEKLRAVSKQRYVSANHFAIVYVGLDEKDQTFAWLEKAYEERSIPLYLIKVEPTWDPVRSDPRFVDLLQRMRLLKN